MGCVRGVHCERVAHVLVTKHNDDEGNGERNKRVHQNAPMVQTPMARGSMIKWIRAIRLPIKNSLCTPTVPNPKQRATQGFPPPHRAGYQPMFGPRRKFSLPYPYEIPCVPTLLPIAVASDCPSKKLCNPLGGGRTLHTVAHDPFVKSQDAQRN